MMILLCAVKLPPRNIEEQIGSQGLSDVLLEYFILTIYIVDDAIVIQDYETLHNLDALKSQFCKGVLKEIDTMISMGGKKLFICQRGQYNVHNVY